MHLTSHITHSNGYAPCIAYYRSNGVDQLFRKLKPKPKLNPPNAHRSPIKICEKWHTHNVQFPFMPNAFRILKPIQKSSKREKCFITQVQTRLPKTKCVWPMKINVICTVALSIKCIIIGVVCSLEMIYDCESVRFSLLLSQPVAE